MRPLTALFCLGLCVPLAGCLSAGATTGDVTPGMSAAPAAAPAPEASAPTMPAGRGASAPKPSRSAATSGKKDYVSHPIFHLLNAIDNFSPELVDKVMKRFF